MVAVDTEHPEDERHPALQWATRQLVSLYPELRLMCISVVRAAPVGEGPNDLDTRTGRHLEHKTRLRHWVEPLGFHRDRISLHVVEGANAASTLLDLARANHVDLIVLGAPAASERALAWWRSVGRVHYYRQRALQRSRRACSGAELGSKLSEHQCSDLQHRSGLPHLSN